MNKIIGSLIGLSLFAGAGIALADSTITTSVNNGASISPNGVVVVPTGVDQTFSTGANDGFTLSDVSVDGISQGATNSVDFTGIAFDPLNHTIDVTATENVVASIIGGGGLIYCSGPDAPGWNVSLPNGGCGVPFTGTQVFGGVQAICPSWFPAGCIFKN